MDKGIRNGVNIKFAEMLPQLKELGGKKFRRIILDWTVENYGATMASASTHYNHSFHATKKATPELVEGLGRPEGKNNGGRKKKEVVVVVDTAVVENDAGETGEAQALFEVRVKKTDAVIVSGLSFEDAKAMVIKAKESKKSALYFI